MRDHFGSAIGADPGLPIAAVIRLPTANSAITNSGTVAQMAQGTPIENKSIVAMTHNPRIVPARGQPELGGGEGSCMAQSALVIRLPHSARNIPRER